jgi:6,7-dimethyl-8-ribityllumazine synthase
MATAVHHLSEHDPASVPSGEGRRFALVVSEWNRTITDALRTGARETLMRYGVAGGDIEEVWVPGSFELASGAQYLLERGGIDGIICLGSVVRGETPHFDFVCHGTTQGIMEVGLKYGRPVIFGVLTDDTMEQALDRSGGRHGNKGIDCAVAVLKMADLRHRALG